MNEPARESPEPSVAQIAATIAVLADDCAPIRAAAQRCLLAWGKRAVPQLREGAEVGHPGTRLRCRALLRALEVRDLLAQFAGLRLPGQGAAGARALLQGAALLAGMVRTFVPAAPVLALPLRRVANALRGDLAGRSLPTGARLLGERLHDELGFRGGDRVLGDSGWVAIDRVLRERVGAPVSLSLVYVAVARWAGLIATGVALPDHFLVRLHGPRPVLIDPFHGGRMITRADCARYLRTNGHHAVRGHLRDLEDHEVLNHYARTLLAAVDPTLPVQARAALGSAIELLDAR